jgi:transposase
MREMSVAEQRYRAVLAVISDGRTVKGAVAAVRVSRQTLHSWLGKCEVDGLEGLAKDRTDPIPSLADAGRG